MTGSRLGRHERRVDRLHRSGSAKPVAWRVREDRGTFHATPGRSFVGTWTTVMACDEAGAIEAYKTLSGVPA